MKDIVLTEYCVYAIADGKKLTRLETDGVSGEFSERKRWTGGRILWKSAQKDGMAMPILFADAAACDRLLYWGVLTKVDVDGATTSFSVDRLRRLKGEHTPQELVLRSSGKNIAQNFIRSYALCKTPQFL